MSKNTDRFIIYGQDIRHLPKTDLIEFGNKKFGLNFNSHTKRGTIVNIIARKHQERLEQGEPDPIPTNGAKHVLADLDIGRMQGLQDLEKQFADIMNGIANYCDGALNPGLTGSDRSVGFVLMVFPFDGHPGRVNYLSNGADRDHIIALMEEQIAGFRAAAEKEMADENQADGR